MRIAIFVALIGVVPLGASSAQPHGGEVLADLQDAYSRFEYEKVLREGTAALERYSEFTVDQLAEIHTILALAAYNQNDRRESRRHFISALQLKPDLSLDPLLVSPKILEFFEEIESEDTSTQHERHNAPVRYVIVPDRRTDAALRSMILPGWGQFYKGHSTKGWILATSFAAAAGGAVFSNHKRNAAEEAYLVESSPDLVASRYDTFNRWHRARGGLLQAAAVVWAAGFVDALLTGGDTRVAEKAASLRLEARSITVAVSF